MKIFIFIVIITISIVKNENINIFKHCGSNLFLEDFGPNSSLQLNLTLIKNIQQCKVNITSSNTHLLYIRIVDNNTENFIIENNQLEINPKIDFLKKILNINEENSANCTLNIYQPELSKNTIYSTNPCSNEIIQDGALVGNKIEIEFIPRNQSTQKWVLITAVGAGEICFNSQMHSCWQQGLTPLLCISKNFLCDDIVHCPTGLLDENYEICNKKNTNWEKIANDLLTKFTAKNKGLDTLLPAIQKGEKRWIETLQTTTINPFSGLDGTKSNTTISPNLTQFGPWSYLMLGMLICGTVLTFCGLWECCCRKNKVPTINISDTPSVVSQPANSTAVLVMTSDPPKYDDLDQPPSYKILFPEKTL